MQTAQMGKVTAAQVMQKDSEVISSWMLIAMALKKLFGLSSYEILEQVSYRICEKFDEKAIAKQYFKSSSRLDGEPEAEAESSSPLPVWAWALVAVGIVAFIALVIGAILVLRGRSKSETV
jgi:anti-sigma-K factor RskA